MSLSSDDESDDFESEYLELDSVRRQQQLESEEKLSRVKSALSMLPLKLLPPSRVENVACESVTLLEALDLVRHSVPEMIRVVEATETAVGLAAPQVGIWKRFFVLKEGDGYVACFNPSFCPSAPDGENPKSWMTFENCLTYLFESLPGTFTERWCEVQCEWVELDMESSPPRFLKKSDVRRSFEGVAFQHECEHLDGITIFTRPFDVD